MKKVYICSPCRGDYENNIQRAKEYSRAAVEKGVIPVTPHIYLTQFMDDNVPEERELALKKGARHPRPQRLRGHQRAEARRGARGQA